MDGPPPPPPGTARPFSFFVISVAIDFSSTNEASTFLSTSSSSSSLSLSSFSFLSLSLPLSLSPPTGTPRAKQEMTGDDALAPVSVAEASRSFLNQGGGGWEAPKAAPSPQEAAATAAASTTTATATAEETKSARLLPPRHPESTSSLESRLAVAEHQRQLLLEQLRSLEESILHPGFRPPSAWAEREAAHRRDRASWTLLASEAASRVRELEAELAAAADGTALAEAEEKVAEAQHKAAAAREQAEAAKAAFLDLRLRVENCSEAPDSLRLIPRALLEKGEGRMRMLSGDGAEMKGLSLNSQVSELRAAFEENGGNGNSSGEVASPSAASNSSRSAAGVVWPPSSALSPVTPNLRCGSY